VIDLAAGAATAGAAFTDVITGFGPAAGAAIAAAGAAGLGAAAEAGGGALADVIAGLGLIAGATVIGSGVLL